MRIVQVLLIILSVGAHPLFVAAVEDDAAAPETLDLKALHKHVLMKTTLGHLRIAMYPQGAPKHCEAFLKWCKAGIYKGVLVNRVTRGLWIESGHHQTRTPAVSEEQKELILPLPKETGLGVMRRNWIHLLADGSESPQGPSPCAFRIYTGLDRDDSGGLIMFATVVGSKDTLRRIDDVQVTKNGGPKNPLLILDTTIIEPTDKLQPDPVYEQIVEEWYLRMAEPTHIEERRRLQEGRVMKPSLRNYERTGLIVLALVIALFGWAAHFFAVRSEPRHVAGLGICLVGIGLLSLFAIFFEQAVNDSTVAVAVFFGALFAFWLFGRYERFEN